MHVAGKDRKRELARQRYERQQARRAAEAARRRRIRTIGVVVVAVIVLGGAGTAAALTMSGGKSKKKNTAAAPTVPPGECAYTASPGQGALKSGAKPPQKPAYHGAVNATIKTSVGTIGLRLDAAKAPCTVNSFAFLAGQKYFDNTPCHRMTTDDPKMLQCGDPTGTGMGGPGYKFKDENLPKAASGGNYTYPTASVAMANSGPNTNGSQFFLVYGDSPLPPNYTIFGTITSGLNVIQDVAKAGVHQDQATGSTAPNKKVTIQAVTISS
jgi:peptidyl-prolyl cis-trans isomerase B (cyclophilin B)